MNTVYHVIIREERRQGERATSREHRGQLHDIGDRVDNLASDQIKYAAEWDQQAPYLTIHKGRIADLLMAYMGWPMEDQATYEARIEAERLAWEAAAPEREAARIKAEEDALLAAQEEATKE